MHTHNYILSVENLHTQLLQGLTASKRRGLIGVVGAQRPIKINKCFLVMTKSIIELQKIEWEWQICFIGTETCILHVHNMHILYLYTHAKNEVNEF